MKWIRITPIENVPPREGRTLKLGSLALALFNTGDRFLAVENRCPHGGGPLAEGIVGGTTVTCPLHNWRVCIESGHVTRPCDSGAPPVRTFPVRVEDGVIVLGFEEEQLAPGARRELSAAGVN